MAVMTAAELRADWLKGLSGTGEDTALERLITRVSARISRHLGYPPASASGTPTIESTAYTRYYGTENVSDDGQVLTLDVLPVTTLTSIYDDLQRAFGSDTLVDSGAYTLLDGSAGKVWIVLSGSHGVWQQGEKNIKVAFTAGWATSPGNLIPPDLLEAHGLLAKVWFEQRGRIGLSSVPQGSGSASVRDPDSDIPIEIRHLLAPYKLPRELL